MPDLKQQAKVKHVLGTSGKCFVALGTRGSDTVFIKSLLPDAIEWKEKFLHEISLYRIFKQDSPNFKLPQLIYADDDILITSYIDGDILESDRYLTSPLPTEAITGVLEITRGIASWKPKDLSLLKQWDYRERLKKYRKRELFSDKEVKALDTLINSYKEPFEIAHGDLLLKNIIKTPEGEYVPIDWEFAGLFMPGFDMALLHTTMYKDTFARKEIETEVTLNNIELPFLINKAMIVAREIHIHRDLPDEDPIKATNLELLNEEKKSLITYLQAASIAL